MDRSARRWFAYLVVTPLGLMPFGGCGNSTAEPTAHVEAENGIPPLLLRVDSPRSMEAGVPHATLTDHVTLPEQVRRLPPVDEVEAPPTFTGVGQNLRAASDRSVARRGENFHVIPLPPVTETYGAGDAGPYLASLPQSVVVPPRAEYSPAAENGSAVPNLTFPEDTEPTPPRESGVDELNPVTNAAPSFDADFGISEPVESASIPELEKAPGAIVSRSDSTFGIPSFPPAGENNSTLQEPNWVEVPAQRESLSQQSPGAPTNGALSERARAMRVVSEQAAVHVRRGMSLASRNAHYSARSEFIQAMRLISQAWDVANDTHEYTESLSAGLRALEEADDFVPRGTQLEADLNLAILIRSHRTPVLKEADPQSLRAIFARQEYYNYAQKELAHCVEGDRSGSMALFGLAKMRASLAQQQSELATLELPKAMALYQAAMLVDNDNYMASNELGVLLARYGQYESAQSMLEHSVRVQPQIESWHNLAVVYHHLGRTSEEKFAQRKYAELVQAERTNAKPRGEVEWMKVEDFNRSTARSQAPVTQTPPKTAAEKTTSKK